MARPDKRPESQTLLCWQSVIAGGGMQDAPVFSVPGEISLYIRQECL